MIEETLLKRQIFVQCANCEWIGRGAQTNDGIEIVGVAACAECGSTSFHELTAGRLEEHYEE